MSGRVLLSAELDGGDEIPGSQVMTSDVPSVGETIWINQSTWRVVARNWCVSPIIGGLPRMVATIIVETADSDAEASPAERERRQAVAHERAALAEVERLRARIAELETRS